MSSRLPDAAVAKVTWWTRSWRWLRPRLLPSVLLIVGVGLALFVAYRSQQPVPPTATEVAFLALSSSLLSIFAGSTFARIGRADPTLARSAVRRLLNVGRGMGSSISDLQTAVESEEGISLVHESIGRLTALLPEVLDATQDWKEVHPEAVREVLAEADLLRKRVTHDG